MLIDSELQAFGNHIGIPDLKLNDKRCIQFILDDNRTLQIEEAGEWIFFFVLKPYDLAPLPYAMYDKALSMPLQNAHETFQVQAIAQSDHDIGFFAKILDTECDQPTLYRLFKYLLMCSDYVDTAL